MQITHRSVGEPAEGSLTRIQRYQQTRDSMFSHYRASTCEESLTTLTCLLLVPILPHSGVRCTGLTVEFRITTKLP